MNDFALSDEQIQILESNNNIVVIADPGSGKTTTLAYKISKVLSKIEDYNGVIAISYTNKASKELKDKSIELSFDIKNSFFGTIDKFYLSEIIIPFSKILYNIKSSIMEKIEIISGEECEYIDELINEKAMIYELVKLINTGKIVLKHISLLANHIFDSSEDCKNYLKSRYKYIMIDEYQDCDRYKHSLFLKLVSIGIKGIAVGDPKQSIFGYAGSSSEFIIELAGRDDFETKILSINRRSHPSITNYALKFISPKSTPDVEKDLRVFGESIIGDESNISVWIDQNIDKILKLYNLNNLSELAVLTRSSRTAELIKKNLKTPNFYYTSTPLDESIFEQDIVAKQIILFIFGNDDVFVDNIFEEYFPKIKRNIKKETYDTILLMRNEYVKNNNINKKSFICLILRLFNDKIDITNIEKVLSNDELLETFKPLDKNKIPIMTIHKSKGSEFKAVLILDLHQYILPMMNKSSGQWVYTNINECKSVHFVSITRAKELVVLIYNTKRHNNKMEMKDGQPSEFISPNIRKDLVAYRSVNKISSLYSN